MAIRTERLGERAPLTLESALELGIVYNHGGHHDRAQPLLERTLAVFRETLGERSAMTISAMNELALLYNRQGRRETPGDEHDYVATVLEHLAMVRIERGDASEAERLFDEAIAIYQTRFGPDHARVARARARMTRALAPPAEGPSSGP